MSSPMAEAPSPAQPERQPFFRVLLSAGSVSLLSQAVALLRQVLIVSFFGFGRALDFYSTVYALMSISVISLSAVLESNYIGLLNARKESQGEAAMRASFPAFIRASLLLSLGLVGLLVLVYPLLSLPFTAGFQAGEKADIANLALCFLPWALLLLPYAAAGACAKSAWHYRQFFTAELMVTLVSTAAISLRHEQVADIALSYACGYGLATAYLLWNLRQLGHGGASARFPWRPFFSRFIRHFGSNQVGSLCTMVERFWFSHLTAGSIAILGVVQQLTMNLASLLSLRDAYLVPLSDPNGRAQKITRLICGMFLLSAAAVTFVAVAAQPIGTLLFSYGKVQGKDIALIATILAIGMAGVLFSTMGTPVWRLLQVSNRYRPLIGLYLLNAACTLVLGYLLVDRWQLGAIGMALVGVANALCGFIAAAAYARSFGASLNRKQAGLLLQSAAVFLGAGWAADLAMQAVPEGLYRLLSGAVTYAAALAAYGFLAREQLRPLLTGTGLWAAHRPTPQLPEGTSLE
jgi:peptidoglycan biosynthesis protein MviN/MurJ (putative lipid II flippase)